MIITFMSVIMEQISPQILHLPKKQSWVSYHIQNILQQTLIITNTLHQTHTYHISYFMLVVCLKLMILAILHNCKWTARVLIVWILYQLMLVLSLAIQVWKHKLQWTWTAIILSHKNVHLQVILAEHLPGLRLLSR